MAGGKLRSSAGLGSARRDSLDVWGGCAGGKESHGRGYMLHLELTHGIRRQKLTQRCEAIIRQ